MRAFVAFFFISWMLVPTSAQKIIFLHHSTGGGVYFEGNVPQWFDNYNAAYGKNYQITERSFPDSPYPWENYPFDYWNLWINNACTPEPGKECINSLAQNYQVIIFKHCFPGSGILPDDSNPSISSNKKTIANYKLQYRALRSMMDNYPETKFIVWTLAPLHRHETNADEASRARLFVDWVKTSWLTEDGKPHRNIFIFDFFGLTAEQNPNPVNGQVNCLKYAYEIDHSGSDSHPNTLANQNVGPLFSQFIVDTVNKSNIIQSSVPVFSGYGLVFLICGLLIFGMLSLSNLILINRSHIPDKIEGEL